MSGRLPLKIDPIRLAEEGIRLSGSLELSKMTRLAPSLVEPLGQVEVELEFDRDGSLKLLHGRVHGVLRLQCQRCMEELELPLDEELNLGLILAEGEADRLPAGYEPLLVTSQEIELAEIVEDELLLSLPLFPMHEEGQCQPARPPEPEEAPPAEEKPNPFGVLAKLKDKL